MFIEGEREREREYMNKAVVKMKPEEDRSIVRVGDGCLTDYVADYGLGFGAALVIEPHTQLPYRTTY